MSWLVTPAEKTPVDRFGINGVSLLLHGNGTNGSTSIIDSSPSPKTITVGGAATISTAESKFGSTSIGSGTSTGSVTANASADFALGTSDFTLELFFFCSDNTIQQTLFNQYSSTTGAGYHGLFLNYPAQTLVYLNGNGSERITASTVPALNTWTHIALVRSAGICTLYYDGTSVGSRAYAGILGRNASYFIAGTLRGYIDEVRFTRGARYVSNFTPPTAPFPDI